MPELNAFTLYVEDVAQSIIFYEFVLECQAIPMTPFFALFTLESGARIALMAKSAVEPKDLSLGGFELAFGLTENSDVDELYQKWLNYGVKIISPPAQNAFSYSFLAASPDNHRLRIYKFNGFKK